VGRVPARHHVPLAPPAAKQRGQCPVPPGPCTGQESGWTHVSWVGQGAPRDRTAGHIWVLPATSGKV